MSDENPPLDPRPFLESAICAREVFAVVQKSIDEQGHTYNPVVISELIYGLATSLAAMIGHDHAIAALQDRMDQVVRDGVYIQLNNEEESGASVVTPKNSSTVH